jgi:hypothetical protein
MKRLIGLIVFVLLCSAKTGYAQFPRFGGRGAMMMFAPFGSGFNPENIVEITGKIKRMTNVKGRMIPTIATVLETDNGEEYEVRLGPMMFIRNMRKFNFRKGIEMNVIGSQIESQGQREVIIAMKITTDGNEIVLRDEMGIPVWAPISRKSGGGMMGMMGGKGMSGSNRMGGGMMGSEKDTGSVIPPAKTFPGEPGQEIQIFGDDENAGEEAEDIQGGKIPGGYK